MAKLRKKEKSILVSLVEAIAPAVKPRARCNNCLQHQIWQSATRSWFIILMTLISIKNTTDKIHFKRLFALLAGQIKLSIYSGPVNVAVAIVTVYLLNSK